MSLESTLGNLKKIGALTPHTAPVGEIKQHIDRAANLIGDAQKIQNTLDTRFAISYDAGHALLMAAVKMNGYRPTNQHGHRQILYQILDELLPGAANAKRALSAAHNARNKAEYDGDDLDPTQGMVDNLISAVVSVKEEVEFNFKKFIAKESSKVGTVVAQNTGIDQKSLRHATPTGKPRTKPPPLGH